MKPFELTILSNEPPGARCKLYTGYARVLSGILGFPVKTIFPEKDDEPGAPALLICEKQVVPVEGRTITPDDIINTIHQIELTVVDMERVRHQLDRLTKESREGM